MTIAVTPPAPNRRSVPDQPLPDPTHPALHTSAMLEEMGYVYRQPPIAIVAVDVAGGGRDHYAVSTLFREEWELGEPTDTNYAVQMLVRGMAFRYMPRELDYTDILASLHSSYRQMARLRDLGRIYDVILLVEVNGVGHGLRESLAAKLGHRRVRGIYTTGGQDAKTTAEGKLTAPRMAMLDHFNMLVAAHRFKIARDETGKKALGARELEAEMRAFEWKNNTRPEARPGAYDDLVMATAMGCWLALKVLPRTCKAASRATRTRLPGHRIRR